MRVMMMGIPLPRVLLLLLLVMIVRKVIVKKKTRMLLNNQTRRKRPCLLLIKMQKTLTTIQKVKVTRHHFRWHNYNMILLQSSKMTTLVVPDPVPMSAAVAKKTAARKKSKHRKLRLRIIQKLSRRIHPMTGPPSFSDSSSDSSSSDSDSSRSSDDDDKEETET